MTVPLISTVWLAGMSGRPLLVLGPSLGTAVTPLWEAAASQLGDDFDVVGWELPGHGQGSPSAAPFDLAELARGVLVAVDRVLDERGQSGAPFVYAGNSVGGAVGLQISLDTPARLSRAVLFCTGARIGDPRSWRERVATVRADGTSAMVEASAQRWFAPGFVDHNAELATTLLTSLRDTDAESYAAVCEALAEFDVRSRLDEIGVPVLAVAGHDDPVTPPALLRDLADRVRDGRFVELDRSAHLVPAEAPRAVASLILAFAGATSVPSYAAGMAVRREVLGDAHVDRASATATGLTSDFQEFITRYAWGGVWTRPGLDRRDRSIAVLTALVAGRHFDELELHLRAALTNGLTREEIVEVLLQSAVYVGVPAANSAFAVANRVLGDRPSDHSSR